MKIAPAIAIPIACPTVRAVESAAEAVPRRSGGTLPITDELLGVPNIPVPTPSTSSRSTMAETGESVVRVVMNSRPLAFVRRPRVVSSRGPMRSESAPMSGASTSIVSGSVATTAPALSVLNPLAWIR